MSKLYCANMNYHLHDISPHIHISIAVVQADASKKSKHRERQRKGLSSKCRKQPPESLCFGERWRAYAQIDLTFDNVGAETNGGAGALTIGHFQRDHVQGGNKVSNHLWECVCPPAPIKQKTSGVCWLLCSFCLKHAVSNRCRALDVLFLAHSCLCRSWLWQYNLPVSMFYHACNIWHKSDAIEQDRMIYTQNTVYTGFILYVAPFTLANVKQG